MISTFRNAKQHHYIAVPVYQITFTTILELSQRLVFCFKAIILLHVKQLMHRALALVKAGVFPNWAKFCFLLVMYIWNKCNNNYSS